MHCTERIPAVRAPAIGRFYKRAPESIENMYEEADIDHHATQCSFETCITKCIGLARTPSPVRVRKPCISASKPS